MSEILGTIKSLDTRNHKKKKSGLKFQKNDKTDLIHLELHFDVLLPVGSARIATSISARMNRMRRRISSSSAKLDFLLVVAFGECDGSLTFTSVTLFNKRNVVKSICH